MAENAGKMLGKLVPDIEKTAELVSEISAASAEQNNGIEQANSAIQQLDSVIQHNAAASEEMAATSEELTTRAQRLTEVVSFFELGSYATLNRDEITETPASDRSTELNSSH